MQNKYTLQHTISGLTVWLFLRQSRYNFCTMLIFVSVPHPWRFHCLLVTLFFFSLFPAHAETPAGRHTAPLPGPWRFHAFPFVTGAEAPSFDDSLWATVRVPHTGSRANAMTTYKAAWYRTHFTRTAAETKKPLFVCFDGAATLADVWLNGVYLGQHRGAYTRFVLDATRAAAAGDNVLAVRCNTDPQDTRDCLPGGDGYQLYHVYGGLYRPVRLLTTPPVHLDSATDGASGVFLTPQNISAARATLAVQARVRSDALEPHSAVVASVLKDAAGQIVAQASETVALTPGASQTAAFTLAVPRPHLWGLNDSYLYTVQTTVSTAGQAPDTVTERTGFRFFRMTPTGFTLNGKSTPLRGVAKHQETEASASALSEAELREDWASLRDLGVNYVRLAHYPHAALEYDLADENGIAVWAENGHSHPAAGTKTGDQITREMVLQNYNHPSIFFWSIGNEAIGGKTQKRDIQTLRQYARAARAEDPTRPIVYASNTKFAADPALDFVAVNRYNGWYGGSIRSFDAHALFYHFISETGAGGVISTHTTAFLPTHKVNTYEPEEYQQEVAEERCQLVFRDHPDDIPLFTWWTYRDFGDPRYKGVNSKGLETYGGFRKDIWYLFQSFLRPALPVVHLCGKPWFLRRFLPGETLQIKAYSNAAALTLTVNGKEVGTQKNGSYDLPVGGKADNVFSWPDALQQGRNLVTVSDGQGHSDTSAIYTDGGTELNTVRDLVSSNPLNPAVFIDQPVHADWPVYTDFDSTADNTFGPLPAILEGARPVATRRVSHAGLETALSFALAPGAGRTDVFLVVSTRPAPPSALLAGWTDTGVRGQWRDNSTQLVQNAVYRQTLRGGGTVRVPAVKGIDYAVLIGTSPQPSP